jgi:hypothetical protein
MITTKTDNVFRVKVSVNGCIVKKTNFRKLFKQHPNFHDLYSTCWCVGKDVSKWEYLWVISFLDLAEKDKNKVRAFCRKTIKERVI